MERLLKKQGHVVAGVLCLVFLLISVGMVAESKNVEWIELVLSDEEKNLFVPQYKDGYTYFRDATGEWILAVTDTKSVVNIAQVVEKDRKVTVYLEETSPRTNQTGNPTSFFQLDTKTGIVAVKLATGEKTYQRLPFKPDQEWQRELIEKYVPQNAPQLRFHPDEISFPSPVEGVVNKSYKVKPFSKKSFTKLTTGVLPELAINDHGDVLEIHRTTSRVKNGRGLSTNYSYEIHYRVGTLQDDGSIDFSGHIDLTTGRNPSIDINNNGYVIEAHRHSSNDGIDIRYGKLDGKKINFHAKYNRTEGENPSVAINDKNIFVMVNEHGTQLEYHFGKIKSANEITFYRTKEIIPFNGYRPSVAINNLGQVVISYELGDKIYYLIGQVIEENNVIDFYKPIYLTSGTHSSIDLDDAGNIIEIHQTSNKHVRKNSDKSAFLRTMIHYRFGELEMNYGVGKPYIAFSDFIELTSGVTPDIVLNNQGDLVEIHETSSMTNTELHYRVLKGGYTRQVITRLKDLPANKEWDYSLVQKGEQSWEVPRRMGKMDTNDLKLYVVIGAAANKRDDQWRLETEIEYNFFYPYNGTNILGFEHLMHMGDWEKIYVTLDLDGNVVNYRYNHHSDSTIYPKDQVILVDSTHPVVYSGLETHASYPRQSNVVATGGDELADGIRWNSYEDENYEVVKIHGLIVGDNDWIHWRGRWGTTLNSPDSKMWR